MFYLNCHSYYSLRYGTMPVEKLVAEALKYNATAMALTDINNSMGMMDFISECRIRGIKPIAGTEFRNEKNRLLFIALAINNNGFREINVFLTRHNLAKSPLPLRAPAFDNVFVIYPFQNSLTLKPAENEFIGIRPEEINRLVTSRYRYFQQHLVVLLPVTFAGENEYQLHKHLRAIENNTLLSKLMPEDLASPKEIFIPPDFVSILYGDYPQILRNTQKISEACSIDIDFNTVKNKRTFAGSRYDDRLLLEKLAHDGLDYRYGKTNHEALKRVQHELEVIDKLGFSAYFLITWDIVRYSMSKGVLPCRKGQRSQQYCRLLPEDHRCGSD